MFEADLNQRERQVDWPMWLAILGLMLIGTAFIYSATSVNEADTLGLWERFRKSSWAAFGKWFLSRFYIKQTLAYGLGVGAAAAFCLFDYHRLARWSLVIYWVTILLLVAVILIGNKVLGARRWIDLGVFQFQPSEFAKLSVLLVLANFLSRPSEELRSPSLFFKTLGLTLLPFVLILKEPDLGSALVLLPICLVLMFVAGVPRFYLKSLLGGAGILVGLLVVDILFAPPYLRIPLQDYQRDRLLVYFAQDFASHATTAPERERARQLQRDRTYNIEQALISVGSGGLTGKGWRQGTQNALGYLPKAVAHNDFIFSVIAEEKGFLGSVIVLTLYTVILFTGIRIAGQARDRLGRLLAIGVVTMFFSHIFINIGMNIRIMPVTGIPLPLLSYGGTSVLCSLIAAGILQNIYIYRRSY